MKKIKIKMVVGFMFNKNETDVLLIQKTHPAWQAGKLNGIGGKVNKGESYHAAMVREFKEEAGIADTFWTPVVVMGDDIEWEVQVFTAKSDDVFNYRQMEDEVPLLIPINELDSYDHISNLRWLVPMCLDNSNINYKIRIT